MPNPRPISRTKALELWKKLHNGLVITQEAIEEIIERKAWEPLGYGTFEEAWTAQVGAITLAAELRPHVIYQMFAEGLTPEQVAERVRGVGRDRAESLHRQRRNGVPPGDASMYVRREHEARMPSAPSIIHIPVGVTRMKRLHRIAKRQDKSLEDIGLELFEAWEKEMRS